MDYNPAFKIEISSACEIPISFQVEQEDIHQHKNYQQRTDQVDDPLIVIKIENIIRAIGRGFSPQNAFRLFDDNADFYIFDLYDYVGKKPAHIRRLKSRIIGREGKTKRVLEELTDSKISIYGHTISIISDILRINILKKSIDMIIIGSKHATVYRYVESQIKELRREERYGF